MKLVEEFLFLMKQISVKLSVNGQWAMINGQWAMVNGQFMFDDL
ncbi:MAG: hypothetical protein ABIN67_07780 [Ferruginibacter sp.]